MLELFGRFYRLAGQDGPGLSCDENGAKLGPITLVKRNKTNSGLSYAVVDPLGLAAAFKAAFGATEASEINRIEARLNAIAHALNAGNPCLAAIIAVQMRVPEFGPGALKRITALAKLLKAYNPDEPRVPAGNPDGGEWTGDGDSASGQAHLPQTAQAIPFPPPPIPIPGVPNPYNIPNIPFPDLHLPQFFEPTPTNPYPDRPECVEEWAAAREFCKDQMKRGKLKPAPPGFGGPGFGKDFNRCVLGQVSADCGGNPTD